ncbi:phosphate regulon sensor protein PhoR [Desulfocucumis palustris]|uniref:histidine kinase n=1 Tax=Desulfocucumis palustris TaxID=1898651 RepID=A0A2L2XF47_9FIRM|nr:HAMP domain-containing sensor histidine kinase [Desulfocucumis palustris]GBF34979.1 phosphate regulon sensor protein PhoR [Desulfocucumis palustris]
MSRDYDTKALFTNENKVLESAKAVNGAQFKDNPLWPLYEELVLHYEKLLKVTAKISKISDIQGQVLKEHEYKIKQANENLCHMEESRRKLFSDISHELGTPMTTIQGYVRAMLDGVVKPDEYHLEMVYNKILLVNQLVEDLYELSKLESDQIKFYYKQVMLEELVDNLIQRFGEDITQQGFNFSPGFTASLPEDAWVILSIDTVRIEQVMNNLVQNAMKYTPPGGTIGIKPELRFLEKYNGIEARGELIIKVVDTGPGIDESALPYIFDRFFREGRAQKFCGAGLGLAIAKQIILKHSGQIGVESRLNAGSTFYFSLPVRIVPHL